MRPVGLAIVVAAALAITTARADKRSPGIIGEVTSTPGKTAARVEFTRAEGTSH